MSATTTTTTTDPSSTVGVTPFTVDPVHIQDIASFMQSVVTGFEDVIFYGFSIMFAFAVIMGIRRLITGASYS